MRNIRLASSLVIIIALVVLSFRASAHETTLAPQVPCTTTAFAKAFGGDTPLTAVQKYGCEGQWAFVWATVGHGLYAIGVTEVLRFNTTAGHWKLVSRLHDCKASVLPSVVYRQGCFSI